MRKNFLSKLLSVIVLFCLLLNGCGDISDGESGSSGSQQEVLGTDASQQDILVSGSSRMPAYDIVPTLSPAMQTANDALDASAENVITLGVMTRYNHEILEMAARFNEEQSQYKVKLVQYGYDSFIINIMRGQGPDIFSLSDLPVDVLAKKDILEDLAPYFAASDVVHQENIVDAVWKAGTNGGKMTRLIPSFAFEGIIVEKGHTNNGGWTVSDYLALAEKYPEGMINQDIADPINLFLNDLRAVSELYIDWEAETCSFDSADFIDFLGKMKKNSKKTYNINSSGTPAERLYKREYLTLRTQLYTHDNLSVYLQLKTLLGDEFELAGYPGANDDPYYCMIYKYALGMNSFSAKKEGAWAFFEYLLSEPIQEEYAKGEFPARLDVLNHTLQDAIDFDPNKSNINCYNSYTQEMEEARPAFTDDDRRAVLEMLDHVKCPDVMNSGDIKYIILDELKLFFNGSKTAEDTAALIQNRVQLYLDELK